MTFSHLLEDFKAWGYAVDQAFLIRLIERRKILESPNIFKNSVLSQAAAIALRFDAVEAMAIVRIVDPKARENAMGKFLELRPIGISLAAVALFFSAFKATTEMMSKLLERRGVRIEGGAIAPAEFADDPPLLSELGDDFRELEKLQGGKDSAAIAAWWQRTPNGALSKEIVQALLAGHDAEWWRDALTNALPALMARAGIVARGDYIPRHQLSDKRWASLRRDAGRLKYLIGFPVGSPERDQVEDLLREKPAAAAA